MKTRTLSNGFCRLALVGSPAMNPAELAGLHEIAEMFGVTKNTALKYAGRSDFPAAVDRLAAGPVWRLADVEAWGREHLPLPTGRPPRGGRRPIKLELRHLWTSTGSPLTWSFEGSDERELRHLLERLDEFKADPAKRSAVLVATEDDGATIGAWTRQGAAHLQALIEAIPGTADWMNVRHALRDAVTGP
jgi:hypothetical protein